MKLADVPNVRVLLRRSGPARFGQVALVFLGVVFGLFAFLGFRDDDTWLEYPLLAVSLLLLIGLVLYRQKAYLVSEDAIADRSGVRRRESPAVRWSDVVAITWNPPARPRPWPVSCVLWTPTGGHRGGLQLWAIKHVLGSPTRELRERLEQAHGPLGGLHVDASELTKDDRTVLLELLERRQFAPLPILTEPVRGLVSYPREAT